METATRACVCACVLNSRAAVVFDEVQDSQVVADLGEVHGRVCVFGQDVAVGTVLQQEPHNVCIPPLTGLGRSGVKVTLSNPLHVLVDYVSHHSVLYNVRYIHGLY